MRSWVAQTDKLAAPKLYSTSPPRAKTSNLWAWNKVELPSALQLRPHLSLETLCDVVAYRPEGPLPDGLGGSEVNMEYVTVRVMVLKRFSVLSSA